MSGCPVVLVDGRYVGDRVSVPRVGNGIELSVITALFHPPSLRPVVNDGGSDGETDVLLVRRAAFLRQRIRAAYGRLPLILGAVAEAAGCSPREYLSQLSSGERTAGVNEIRVIGMDIGVCFQVASWDAESRSVRAPDDLGIIGLDGGVEGGGVEPDGSLANPSEVWLFYDGFGRWGAITPPCPAPLYRSSSIRFREFMPGWGLGVRVGRETVLFGNDARENMTV